jgi:hypothetical protein
MHHRIHGQQTGHQVIFTASALTCLLLLWVVCCTIRVVEEQRAHQDITLCCLDVHFT